jgi:Cu+-exporting ATPase
MMRHLAWLVALAVAAPAAAAPRKAKVKEIALTVTKQGFEPAVIEVKKGEKVKLVVTRKEKRTCATEIVFRELGIEKELPLDTPVVVELGAVAKGEHRFGCSMQHIAGKVVVE